MRVGLIADLHGNVVALDSVLAALAAEGVERIVCLGDVAATGPRPAETVARLRELGCPVVMGNADAWLLDPPAARSEDETWRRFEEIDAWCAAQLSTADLAYLRSFRPTVEVPLGEVGTLLCCHGSPRSYDDQILATTPDDELDRLLDGLPPETAIVAAGHTHAQLLRRHRHRLLLNPGSVGLAVAALPPADPVRNAPWAEYAVVTAEAGRLEVALRRTPLDVGAVVRAALASGMPHAAWWAAEWPTPGTIPAPPTEAGGRAGDADDAQGGAIRAL
jgi:predicted phosphodiesterase